MNTINHDLLPGLLCSKKGHDIKTKACNYCKSPNTELRTIAFEYDLEEIHIGMYCNGCTNKSILTFKLDYVEVHDSHGLMVQGTKLGVDE